MGSAVGSSCFADSAAAAVEACARVGGATGSGVVTCSGVAGVTATGASLDLVFTDATGSAAGTQALVFQPCEPLTVGDGVQLGWAVGGVWLAVAALRWIAVAVRA